MFPNRVIYFIDVPNISIVNPKDKLSQNQVTKVSMRKLIDVIKQHSSIDKFILSGHSLGTFHAGLVMNICPFQFIHSVILFDPFCHPVYMQTAQRFACLPLRFPCSLREILSTLLVGRDLEVQLFAAMFVNEYNFIWKPHPSIPILSVFSQHDNYIPYNTMLNYFKMLKNKQSVSSVPGPHCSSVLNGSSTIKEFISGLSASS